MLNYMVRNQFKYNWTLFTHTITNCTIMANVRWAFNTKDWQPSLEEMTAASSYIQPEEKQRISRFHFQDDAKSTLIGRLLLRKFVHDTSLIPYNEIRFTRDSRGKPCLANAGDIPINFNVSHQGDYVVLAGTKENNIGIDVMRIEPPVNKDIPEFFSLMNRQFSIQEWAVIKSFPTELEQIACFYRLWCLKESYVKNVGVGITIPLIDISFATKTRDLRVGETVADTVLYVRGKRMDEWVFEETLLDESHAVAVAMKQVRHEHVPFSFLNFNQLVAGAQPLYEPDLGFSSAFMEKELKYF